MNFATLTYAGFLGVVIIVYWLIPRHAGRYWLIAASLLFYGSWNALYVPAFVALIYVNWRLGALAGGPHRRLAVTLAILLDLGLLAIFKYLDWGTAAGWRLIGYLSGPAGPPPALGLILPLAISFVTFTMLAYVFDIARGGRPEPRVSHFALFVTFFPHLIAGPIMRGREFLPQVRHPRPFALQHLQSGAPLLVSGLVKKVLADNLGPFVEASFADPAALSTVGAWLGVLAFAFQILFDFSGYTDLALGSAFLLGFRLPRNFDWPYRAHSIRDFWRRWHMTLSRWLRDYVYISLGGSRHGRPRMYLALLVTMILGGLWHGAGATFLIWGAWQGTALAVNRWWSDGPGRTIRLPELVSWSVTFSVVLLGWVLFRADGLRDAVEYLGRMVFPTDGNAEVPPLIALALGLAVVGQWTRIATTLPALAPRGSLRRQFAYGGGVLAALILFPSAAPDFIYFQF